MKEMSINEKIALTSLVTEAIEINTGDPFLTNGYYNPIRFNMSKALFFNHFRKLVAGGFYKTICGNCNNLIVAGETSLATIIAEILNTHLIINVGDIKKDLSGSKVVLIQDTITDESISVIDAIRKEKGICDLCLTVIDFGFPDISRKMAGEIPYGKDPFHKTIPSKILLSPCEVKSLITLPLLLKVATEKHFMKNCEEKTIFEWMENRETWGEKHGFPPPIKKF